MNNPVAITVTTANICGNPLRPKRFVRRRMRRALAQEGIVFGQEVAHSNRWRRGNYNAMWRAVAVTRGKETVGGPREVPISYPVRWNLDGSYVLQVHDGRRRVSPARFINVAKFTIGDRRVAFVNCHPVSKPRRGVPASRWRIGRWDLYLDQLRAQVTALHADGYTVVAGGDMNKRAVPKLHPDQVQLVESGLDHLWTVPADGASARVTHRSKVARSLLMDHPILTATFDLS